MVQSKQTNAVGNDQGFMPLWSYRLSRSCEPFYLTPSSELQASKVLTILTTCYHKLDSYLVSTRAQEKHVKHLCMCCTQLRALWVAKLLSTTTGQRVLIRHFPWSCLEQHGKHGLPGLQRKEHKKRGQFGLAFACLGQY